MNASEKNKKRNKNYKIRPKENEGGRKEKKKDVRYVVWDSVTHPTRTTTLGSGSGGRGSEWASAADLTGKPALWSSSVLPTALPKHLADSDRPGCFRCGHLAFLQTMAGHVTNKEGPSHGHGWWLPPKARPAPKDQVGSPQTHLTMSRSPPPSTIPTRACSPKRPLFKIFCAIQFICFKKKKK